jgi:capsular polysaccharide transport system permease protein
MDSEETDLDIDARLPGDPKPGTALARVRAVSLALSDAARRTRMSSRRSARISAGGFADRRGAKAARYFVLGSFVAMVIVPTLLGVIYYGFVAANQYVAEAEFTVSAGESPLRDGVDTLSGAPLQLILQDTQIITNFIHSREIVDKLEDRIGLRRLYSREDADFLARFKPDAPVERLVKYWTHVAAASVKLPGGQVKFSVRAFSPQDAKLVADTTIALCEDLVNSLNARINRDAVALAETSMTRATERLSSTLAAQEVARNESGVIETKLSAEAITSLIRQLKGQLLSMQGAYETQLKYVNADTAQMQELQSRIDVLRQQVAKLEGQLTTQPGQPVQNASARGDSTVAAAMSRLGELEIEEKAAEQLYANAASALEHARIAAEFKMIYLKVYVAPSEPQESEYPQRKLNMFLIAVSGLAAWGFVIALGSSIRNHMA